MNKYKVILNNNDSTQEKEYKSLKEISCDLGIQLDLVKSINHVCENRKVLKRPHFSNREIYEKLKIYNIKKEIIKSL